MKNGKISCSFSYLLLIAFLFFIPMNSAGAVQLIQNGGFQDSLNYWNIYEKAEYEGNPIVEPIPESGDFKLNLHPDTNYFGLVVYQPLNVTNVSGKTLTLNMKLTNFWSVLGGATVNAYIAYVTTTNNIVQEKIASFQNSTITAPDTPVSATYTLPSTGVKKIIGFGLAKEGYGEFLVDDVSLDISGAPTIGSLPRINAIDKDRGPYGTTLTITGVNFGSTQALTSTVTIGDSEKGITILNWSNTQVQVKIDDPALDGSVIVVNDFVPSNNDKKFSITSPFYSIWVDSGFKTYIKGSIAKFFLGTYFENGYSTTSGINFSLNTSVTHPAITTNIVSFKNAPVKIEGGAVLEINTAGLNPGVYPIGVIANDGVMQPRETDIFMLEVVRVGSIKLYLDGNEVTGNSINVGRQYSFNLYYEVYDTYSRMINPPSMLEKIPVNVQSSNEDLLTVYRQFWGDQFFANDNGSPTLTFSTPDGFSRTLTVNINVPNEPKVVSLGIVPDQIINDPNGSTGQSFTYNANHNTTGTEVGYGIYGMYDVDWTNTDVSWGENTASVGGTWLIKGYVDSNYDYLMPIKIGETLVTGSCYSSGGSNSVERVKKLYIVNTPGTSMVSGQVIPAGGFGEVFYIEFYDTQGNFLFPRLAEGYHFQPFTVGFIPSGYYKLKFVFRGNARDYWYPNAYTFEDAQTIYLAGNANFILPYVIATEDLANSPWINPVKKDFGTSPLGNTISQVFTFKNIGNSPMMISGIEIVGATESFMAEHNCPSTLDPFNSCSITVYFTPNSSGQKIAYLKLSGSNPDQGEYLEVPLVGSGQAPVGAGTVLINNNAQFTNSKTVTLNITCDDPVGCSQMCISNDSPTCTTFVTFATTKSWTLSDGDGTKTVYVKLKNRNNQTGEPFSDTIILDTTLPFGGAFTATAGNAQVTLEWNGYTDTTSGIAQYVLYGGTTLPSSCSGTQLYSGNDTSYLHMGLTNGTTYYYRLCIYDNAGNLTTTTASARPLPESNPPDLVNFTINNGDEYTKLNTVTLQIEATDESGVSQMCISNTPTCSSWISYATSMNWTLPTGAGQKTVYIWFKDIWGTANSTPFTAQIILDNVAPVDSTNPLIVNPGEEQNTIKLEWFPATDAHSYIKEYRIMRALSSTGTSCSGIPIAVISMIPAANFTIQYIDIGLLAGKTYYYRVCAVDAVGNLSAGKTGSGKCNDTLGPTDPFVVINNDDIYTKSQTVTLTFGANDPGGIAQVCIGNTPTSFSCSTFVPTNPTKTWRLTTPSGEKTVYVKFKDGAGNESSVVSDSIWLDVVKPIDGKLTAISGNGFVLLSWQDAVEGGGSGLDKYVVKLGATSYPSCTTGITLYEGLEKSFIHEGLTNGNAYYYRVCVFDKAGNVSSGKTYLGKPSELTTITGSFPIATSTKREQALRVAFDGTNYAVAIKGVGTSPNSIGVQFLNKDGAKIGTPLILSGLSSVEPQIAYGAGKYLVVWSDDNSKTIKGQIINASTRTIDGQAFDISQTATSAGCIDTYTNPVFDGNNFFVVWNYDSACTDDGSGHDVFGRFVDADGGMIGGIINLVDETATGRQEYHTMAFDGEYIYVFWQDARRNVAISNPCGGSDLTNVLTDIYGQIISKSTLTEPGTKLGNNFSIFESSSIVDFEIFDAVYNGYSVNVVWQEMTPVCTAGNIDMGTSNIVMAEVYSEGLGGIMNITNSSTAKNFAPQIKSSGDGTVLVTWNDLANMSNIEIWAQRYYGDGTPINDPFLLVSKVGNQFGGVENYSNDKFFILWNDKITVNSTTQEFIFGDVYGALISFPEAEIVR